MAQKFCQSCGMPLDGEQVLGTLSDGSKHEEYCIYCFSGGRFTSDVTMDEMIGISLAHMKELFREDASFNEQEALQQMQSFFPELKRWRNG